jgi:hypothetical protein
MRKLIVAEFITLDGVIQAPGGADETQRVALCMAAGPSLTGMTTLVHTSFKR